MNQVAKTIRNVMRIEVLLGIGLVMWVFSLEVRATNYTPINHLSFGPDVKIVACDPIKFQGRDAPTFYWYALDLTNAKAWQMSSYDYNWSDVYSVEKTPNYLILKQSYERIRIDRKTLRTEHQMAVDSACELSSLEAIDKKAAEEASANTI